MRMLGLTVNTASMVVILAIAALGLNLLVGYTGLTSFGHSAWFGIGAYAAGSLQKHWFHDQIVAADPAVDAASSPSCRPSSASSSCAGAACISRC